MFGLIIFGLVVRVVFSYGLAELLLGFGFVDLCLLCFEVCCLLTIESVCIDAHLSACCF